MSTATLAPESLRTMAEGMRRIKMGAKMPGIGDYDSFEEFVVRNGRPFVAQPLPRKYRRGAPKLCFYNATTLAIRRKLVYVEGYALLATVGGFPIHHAWCVEPDTATVIDVTATNLTDYWGIAFSTKYLADRWKRETKKSHGSINCSLIDSWEDRWPLLRMTADELAAITISEEA